MLYRICCANMLYRICSSEYAVRPDKMVPIYNELLNKSFMSDNLSDSVENKFIAKVSQKATKKLFHNAERDDEDLFQNVGYVPAYKEVRKEEPAINPYAALEEGNRVRDEIRTAAALVSNENEVLVKPPCAKPAQVEKLESNPLIARTKINNILRRPKIVPSK